MKKIFARPKSLKNTPFHYCPGCGHSLLHRIIGDVIDEMNLQERIIGVPPAGCAVLAYNYFDIDMGEASHGRAAALATGLKRVLPDRIVFTYQGDGDIAAIGTAETIHAAARGENITTIFVNNGVYGMTGGQMAPTTVLGQNTTTSPGGRKEKRDGFPINLSEMLAIAKGSAYIERTAVSSPAHILKTKKAIAKAFHIQLKGYGFSLVEVLSPCPTNWKMSPVDACRWIDEVMTTSFPLGVLKDITGDKKMLIKTVFSGFGGQGGVIMMGYLLAMAGMYEEKNVTCLPSYGAEVRGGTANCTVVISTEEIASPVASEPEFAVLMNNPALFLYQNQVQSGGTIFLNSSMIDSRPIRGDLEIFEIPVNDLVKPLHEDKVANMVMLGAFIKKSALVSLETMHRVVKDTFTNRNPAIIKLNRHALLLGYDYLE